MGVERWDIEATDEYVAWYRGLTRDEQDAIDEDIGVLQNFGPQLGRPYVDTITSSRHANLKELRTRATLRTFFAFDPRRSVILLIGGDKENDKRFYARIVPVADRLYDEYLAELREEGLL